ncbi:MFS transporter, partial [Dickeya undicola]
NALFGVLWGVGSFSGPLVSGSLMQWYGRDGLIVILALLGLLFLAANTLLATRRCDSTHYSA